MQARLKYDLGPKHHFEAARNDGLVDQAAVRAAAPES